MKIGWNKKEVGGRLLIEGKKEHIKAAIAPEGTIEMETPQGHLVIPDVDLLIDILQTVRAEANDHYGDSWPMR